MIILTVYMLLGLGFYLGAMADRMRQKNLPELDSYNNNISLMVVCYLIGLIGTIALWPILIMKSLLRQFRH